MGVLSKKLLALFILLVIFLSTWQDFFLVSQLGEIFRSPIILLFPIFVLLEIFVFCKEKFYKYSNNAPFKRINSFFKTFHILYLVVSFFTFIVWSFTEDSFTYLGENVVIKCLKILLYYSLLWLIFRAIYFLLIIANKQKVSIENIFIVLTVFYSLVIVVELMDKPRALMFFHSEDIDYWRVRLLTSESSWTGGIALLLMAGMWLETKIKTIKIVVTAIFLALFIFSSESKQFIGGIFLSLNIFIFFKYRVKYLIFALPLIIIATPIILSNYNDLFIIESFSSDIENYTSTATRFLTFITSILCLLHYPFGTGGFYVPYFIGKFPMGIELLSYIYPSFNFSEVLDLGTKNFQGISPKNSFGSMVVLLGFPGFFLLIWLYKAIITFCKKNKILTLLSIYFIITSFFSENFDTKPNLAIFFALISFYYYKENATS